MDQENAQEGADDTTTPQFSEAETKAMRLGWVPQDQFKGDPDKWRPAEEFLDRGMNMLPLLQRDNEKLHRSMSKLEKKIEEQNRTFEEFQKFTSEAAKREYERGKREAEAKLDTAIQNADVAAAQQARRELAAIEEGKPKEPVTEKREEPKPDPVFQEWIAENKWFNADPALNGYATKVYGQLEQSQPGRAPSELLAETKKRVMEKFPEEFGINPRREAASAVSAPNGDGGAPKKKGKTYNDLDADAKKACDRFVKTIPGYTREKYVKDYFGDEA